MWIDQCLLKRKAQLSNVILADTSDPMRVKEVIAYAENIFREENVNKVLLYEGWRGLQEFKEKDGKLITQPCQVKVDEFQTDDELIVNLEIALRTADQIIREPKGSKQHEMEAVLILTNVPEFETAALQQALKSWAVDSRLFKNQSTIWVLDPDVGSLVGEKVLELAIFHPIDLSSTEERERIIDENLVKLGFIKKAEIGRFAKLTSGLHLHEVESAICLAASCQTRVETPLEQTIFQFKMESVAKKGARLIVPTFGFEGVGGMSQLKHDIEYRVKHFYKNPQLIKLFDIDPPKGALLFGPPGTGKSYFVKALGKELNLPVIAFNLGDLMSKWVGESEKQLNRILSVIDAIEDCVVFMDEVESVAAQITTEGDGQTAARMLSKLLAWMGEDRRAYIVAATNLPHRLREAFIRVGRFDRILPVMYPDEESRVQVLQVHLGGVKARKAGADVDLEAIAKQTEMWNCGELAYVVGEAAVIASHDPKAAKDGVIRQKHLLEAMKTIRVNEQERAHQYKEFLDHAKRYCNDNRYLEEFKTVQESPEVTKRLELALNV